MLFILFIVHRSEFDLQEAKFYLYPKKKKLILIIVYTRILFPYQNSIVERAVNNRQV